MNDEAFALAIGNLVIAGAKVEQAVAELVWLLLDPRKRPPRNSSVGPVVTDQLKSVTAQVRLLRRLVATKPWREEFRADFVARLKQAEEAWRERNTYVHSATRFENGVRGRIEVLTKGEDPGVRVVQIDVNAIEGATEKLNAAHLGLLALLAMNPAAVDRPSDR